MMGRYNFEHKYRGRAIIIINKKFKNPDNNRDGADEDKKMMEQMFTKLGFKVKVYKNLKGEKMLKKLDKASKWEGHKDSDCFVCVVSSHGVEQSIRKGPSSHQGPSVPQGATVWKNAVSGKDEIDVPVEDIVKKFDQDNCKDLAGKPKLFFIQACRVRNDGTNKYDFGVVDPNSTNLPGNNGGGGDPNDAVDNSVEIPEEASGGGASHVGASGDGVDTGTVPGDNADESRKTGNSEEMLDVASRDGPNVVSGDAVAVVDVERRTNRDETDSKGGPDTVDSKVDPDTVDSKGGPDTVDSKGDPDTVDSKGDPDMVDSKGDPDKNRFLIVPYDIVPIECPKDCLLMFPVGTGKLAMRNPATGSYLMQYLFDSPHKEEFVEGKMNLLQYLTMVCKKMSDYEYTGPGKAFSSLPLEKKIIHLNSRTKEWIADTKLTREQLLNLPFKMTAHVIHRLTDTVYFTPKQGTDTGTKKLCSLC